jgi:hypothetical protein
MAAAMIATSALAACASSPAHLPPAREVAGRATVVSAKAAPLPPDHPPVAAGDPIASADHVGRAPRRLNVDQLRAALLVATGFTWVASRRVSDPESPTGFTNLPDADMLDALASTLGRADYATTTTESVDPAVTFSKLAGDAARASCRASVRADASSPAIESHRILRFVTPKDTAQTNAAAVRANLAYLALRFWGRTVDPKSSDLEALVLLFDRAARAAGTEEGWRAVCIAMATDPQFLTY